MHLVTKFGAATFISSAAQIVTFYDIYDGRHPASILDLLGEAMGPPTKAHSRDIKPKY